MGNKKTIVAVNKKTGTKYIKAVCKNGVCRVATKGSHGSFVVLRKSVQLVK